jgi:hypothetical protein
MSKFLLKMAIEIVDLPIDSMVIFHSYVSLPEGTFYVTFIEYYIIIFHMHPCAPCMVYLPTLLGDFLQAMLVNIPAPWVAYGFRIASVYPIGFP